MTDEERLAEIAAAADRYGALAHHLGEIIGHKLFTLMVIDRARNEAARLYSSNPDAYPPAGRKPLGDLTEWGAQVLGRGLPYIGYTADDIRSVFFDHAQIEALGCASVLNLPVLSDDGAIGTVNLLHEAGWYTPQNAERGAPFAALLVPDFLSWGGQSPAAGEP